MLCGLLIFDLPMTTRSKLGLPSKSDNPTSSDRDPARKPVRNSTAKSRTLSRNTTQVAPETKASKPRGPRADGDSRGRPPRKDFGDRAPRSDRPARAPSGDAPRREWTPRPEGDRPSRKDFGDRAPRGDHPARAPSGDAPRREWTPPRTPRPEGDRPPRKDFGDRAPRGDRPARAPSGDAPRREWTPPRTPRPEGDRPPRKDFGDRAPRGDRPARAPSGDALRREWTPRPEGDRPPRKDFGDRAPRSDRPARAQPAGSELRPATPWEERDMDKRGRVKAVPASEDGESAKDGIRVSRYLADRGAASRREADDWIVRGWVTVDGETAVLGQRVLPHQKVEVHKEARIEQAQRVTVLMHKPVGYVSGQAEDGHEPASVLFLPENQWMGDTSGQRFNRNHLRGLAPAGRLDIDSHGLLVLTQDGRVARTLIGEDSTIEKEYLVRVRAAKSFGNGPLSEEFPAESMDLLNHGLELDGEPLKPAKVSWQNEEQMRFVLREGKKRQIRRMCEAVGLEVVALKRVRIGRIPLADLPVGKWRYLRSDEAF
jgi:23S rRNA pseudouridine2604 synthase